MRDLFQTNGGPGNHVSDDLLVRHADGELPQREVGRVDAHLKYCWTCRTRRDQIEQAISDVVQYQDRQLRPYLPPAPGGRSMFLARLNQLADQEAARSTWGRVFASIVDVRGWRMSPAWIRVAVAASLILIGFIFSLRTPAVSAAEFLRRARSAEIQSLAGVPQPVVFRKIKIHAGGHSVTRAIDRDTASLRRKDQLAADTVRSLTPVSSGTTNETADLKQIQKVLEQEFIAANLDWQDPLSVSAYQSWHDGLEQRKEDVTSMGDELLLTTSTPEGPIAEASLRVREHDFHAVSESVRLRDDRQIEIEEIEYRLIPGSMASDIFPVEPPSTGVNPAAVPQPIVTELPAPAPSEAELADAEVQALVALHAIGADLGEPVEIVRTQAGIEARGLAVTTERKAQLRAALTDIPNLAFRVRTVAEVSESAGARGNAANPAEPLGMQQAFGPKSAERAAVVAGKAPLQDYVTDYFASKHSRESQPAKPGPSPLDSIQGEVKGLSSQAIAISEKTMAEAWALHRLAKRYTPKELGKLSPKARGALETIIRDQVGALKKQLAGSSTLLVPVLVSIPNTTAGGNATRHIDKTLDSGWPESEFALFELVNYVDRITNGLFAGADFPSGLEAFQPGNGPLRIKSTEDHAADLLFLYQYLEQQFPRLEARVAGSFLSKTE